MKVHRFLRALPLALSLISSARAEQGTIVSPTVGPKTMTEVMTVLNAAMLAIQSCNSGSSAPANGAGGAATHYQCWADTTTNPVLYKTYDGASWVTFGALNTSTHVWTPYRNGSPIAAVATSSSAADLTTGTLPSARLPFPAASTLGGIQSKTCSASQWLNDVSTSGVLSCGQPNFTDLAGAASLAQLPAFSGMSAAAAASDADTFPTNQSGGNLKQTLAAIKTWVKAWIVKADVALGNVDNTSDATKWAATKTLLNTTYNCGSTGNVCTIRLASDITGFGTGVAAAMGVNIGSAGAPVVFGGVLGTPSSGIATNLTGTAAGLTAGNVTTNANTTGDVTSVGNVTTLTNAPVIAKVLTAFSASAGTVSSSDSILTAFQKIVGNLALKANSASPVITGVEDNQGTLKLSSFVTATQLTANQNDYTSTDGSNTCSTKTSLRISTNASRNVTGLSCGQAEGDIRIIHNVGSFAAVLTNQDAGSSASNRFLFGGDMTLAPDTSVTIKFDGVASRWRAITTPGAGGGGGVTSVAIAAGEGVQVSGTCTITTSGTCTVARSDTVRQNEALSMIYDAKAFGSYRRFINAFADGYKATSDGVNAGASSLYTLDTANGRILPTFSGGVTSQISTSGKTLIGSLTSGGGIAAAFDGVTNQATSASAQVSSSVGGYGNTIGVDWGLGTTKTVSRFSVYAPNDANIGPGSGPTTIKLQGSPDNATWTDLYTTGSVGTGTAEVVNIASGITTSSAYRYHRVNMNGNGSQGLRVAEVQFYDTSPVVYDNMTIVTTAQASDASVSSGRVLIEYDNSVANPGLNTDLTADVSCNGGTNWTSAFLSAVTSNSQGGRKVVETVDQACTSGTSFAARIKTLNNKNVPVYGVSLTAH